MRKKIIFIISVLYSLSGHSQISLEDIWLAGKYRADYYSSFNWTSDGQHYTEMTFRDDKGSPKVDLYHIRNGFVKELTDSTLSYRKGNLKNTVFRFGDYSISPDQSKILFAMDEEPIYRRSSKADYYLFDVKSGSLVLLNASEKGKISYPEFSPDGKRIAFVRNNDLYVTTIEGLQEKAITTDGKFNFIINGACDWVYEEEFEFAKAFSWSSDGKKIAFYRFDETMVKEYNMQIWGNIYPEDYKYKYPKAGEENSQVKICCALIEENKIIDVDLSSKGEKEYFPRLRWTGDPNVISYYRMNRLQNNLEIVHYTISTRSSQIVYKEKDKAYVEINDNHFYLGASEDFVFTNEQSGFRHVYLYSKGTNTVKPLTTGLYEVAEVLGVNEKNKLIYFISQEDSPMEKQLYSVDFSGKKKKKLTKEKGVHDISFCPTFDYYIDAYSNANTPSLALLKETAKGSIVKTMTENTALRTKMEQTKISKINFFKFTTTQNTELNAWMIKPIDFDPAKKYPVIVTIYGGPGSQEVMDGWKGTNYFWYQMLAQQGYTIVCVDGRGTGGRGAAFKKLTQLNLGKYETEDLIETAKYLQSQAYVDPKRIGIFGWSYGGYLSSLAITKGSDYFKSAIAVAPVTNWRYYDNIYTERYMGLPKDNSKGYDENAPAYFAKELKGNYLLIHGTADDNVHIQNSLEMQRALIKANKQFDMFYYPDRNHSIYGGNTRYHLYKMMTEFILKKL
jgi:dipeptidyl-peptidase-4